MEFLSCQFVSWPQIDQSLNLSCKFCYTMNDLFNHLLDTYRATSLKTNWLTDLGNVKACSIDCLKHLRRL